jgi:RNA polymerase sigma-70 factor (ECF subfamily)
MTLAVLAMANPAESPQAQLGLIEAAKAGDLAAFDILMRQHERMVLVTAYRLLGSLPDAQDVSQEVFLKLYRNLGRVEAAGSLAGWLYRVTANACHDVRRRKRPAASVEFAEDLRDRGADPQQAAAEAERRRCWK